MNIVHYTRNATYYISGPWRRLPLSFITSVSGSNTLRNTVSGRDLRRHSGSLSPHSLSTPLLLPPRFAL